jgi:hypothetical protein
MDIQEERRGRLRAYIATNFPREGSDRGNVNAFAQMIGIQQSQIADMLDRRKSFGEKVARRLEAEAAKRNMPPMNLDGVDTGASEQPALTSATHVQEPTTRLYGHDVTEEAVMFAKEWEKLTPPLRAQVQALVHVMVAEIVRDARGGPVKKLPKPHSPDRPRPHG